MRALFIGLAWAGGVLGLAVLAADVLGRQLGLGALGGGARATRQVALTFDDGPGEGTPALLDVLARHHAPATFFLTGTQARRFPAMVQAIRAAGHQLESHGDAHRHALLLFPWQERRQLAWHPEPGRPGRLYRPPWGGHSPWTRTLARRMGMRVALWTAESRDWHHHPGEELARELAPTLGGGDVLLLHDGPGPERTARTVALLEALLPALAARGLTPVTLAELNPAPIRWPQGWTRLQAMWRR